MTDFDRILHTIESAEAEARAERAVEAASATAARSLKVAHARKRFADVGVAAYLQEQAASMQAQGFHAEVKSFEIDDRAHVSMEFVPSRGEALVPEHCFGANSCSLVILGFANGNVNVAIVTRNTRDTVIPGVDVDALTLAHLQEWFERFVQFGLAYARKKPGA